MNLKQSLSCNASRDDSSVSLSAGFPQVYESRYVRRRPGFLYTVEIDSRMANSKAPKLEASADFSLMARWVNASNQVSSPAFGCGCKLE
jgi:hypothetical protein